MIIAHSNDWHKKWWIQDSNEQTDCKIGTIFAIKDHCDTCHFLILVTIHRFNRRTMTLFHLTLCARAHGVNESHAECIFSPN